MKPAFIFLCYFLFCSLDSVAQKLFTKSGRVEFSSKTPLEDIEATHRSAVCVLDTESGSLDFSILIKGFEFENEEMQEHFNGDYLESDKFPKAQFKGQIINNSSINYKKPGRYTAQVKGQITIHGVSKDTQASAILKIENDHIAANSTFTVQVSDYNIKIPALVKDKIAKSVNITIDARLDPLKAN
ncbi:MAG TPA: YceI family protein [Chitinophagaceae bacterium]|jgi:polyisoprenoid-binding protein YceI|nr:YceI family protein [Chitinophagaceae bacterium]